MSTIRAATISDVAGTGPSAFTAQWTSRFFVNYDQNSTTSIDKSGNNTSVTDNSTGDYTINHTNAMGDALYYVGAPAGKISGGLKSDDKATYLLAASVRLTSFNAAGTVLDYALSGGDGIGDLA